MSDKKTARDTTNTSADHCLNCNTPLQGDYCHQCGEKKIHPHHDYSLKEFAEDTIDGFTHFESKGIKTFWHLLTRPGRLSFDYIRGQRKPYLKPMAVFLISAVLFYFFMPRSGSFYVDWQGMVKGYEVSYPSPDNLFKYDLKSAIRKKIHKAHPEVKTDKEKTNAYAVEVINKATFTAAGKSKTFLFVIIPFLALFLWCMFYKKQPYLVPHLIFALHFLSVFLLVDLVYLIFAFDVFKAGMLHYYQVLPVFIGTMFYGITAIKKVYGVSTATATGKGFLFYLFFLLILLLYRTGITIWSYAITQA
jgi:hypothetical protein